MTWADVVVFAPGAAALVMVAGWLVHVWRHPE